MAKIKNLFKRKFLIFSLVVIIAATGLVLAFNRNNKEKTVATDLSILKSIARFIDRRTKYGRLYDFVGTVDEFERTLKNELDFAKEGGNADTFRKNLAQDEGVTVPRVKWVYTTKRVLTMEYLGGIRIDDIAAFNQTGINREKVAEKLMQSFCNQVLRDGFLTPTRIPAISGSCPTDRSHCWIWAWWAA
jgi:ubiquinone biosynthesis protein